jgi:crotonobetainyl-CoA:carnitine CoA-transferase CaiB-like acyl-CoA transferase
VTTALEDVTVLDLSHALAGPFASAMLGDFGARVIKMEPPGAGDIARGWGPPFYAGESAYFVNLHRNKKSVEVDLEHSEGRELFFRLMERSDGEVPTPMGTAYKALLPYQTFATRTRDLALAVGSEKLWRTFCPLVGLDAMMDDPRYATNAARAAHRATLIATLQQVFLAKAYEEGEALLLPAGIPVGAINTIDTIVDHPQVKARGMIVETDHPVAGRVQMVGVPVKMSDTPGTVREPAPLLGQHTDEVVREMLGLDDGEIDRLRRAGALGAPRGGRAHGGGA